MKKFGEYRSCRSCGPLLVGYLEHQLDGKRRARVEAHLASCPACQGELAAAKVMAEVLQGHRAAPARIETDLWSRIEADIRKSPRSAPHAAHAPHHAVRSRSPFLRDSGRGQALPFAAAVFAAGILAMAIVDSPHHPSETAQVAARMPAAMEAANPAVPTPHGTGAVQALPSVSVASIATGSIANGSRILHDSRSAFPVDVSDTRHSESRLRPLKQIARWSSPANSPRTSALAGSLRSVAAPAERIAAIAHGPVVSSHGSQVAALSDRYIGGLNVGPLADTVAASSDAHPDQANVSSGPDVVGSSLPSTAKTLAARGSYAVDDEAGANVSVADISGSVRRQQGLFSYTQQ